MYNPSDSMTEMEQERDTYIDMQTALLFRQVCYIPMETHVLHAKSHYSLLSYTNEKLSLTAGTHKNSKSNTFGNKSNVSICQ